MPPLGIAYLCAVLKKEGYRSEVFDFNADLYPQYKQLWESGNDQYWHPNSFFLKNPELDQYVNKYARKILESLPDVIGFSVAATSRIFSELVAKKIKELDKSKITIFGGPECYRERPEFLFNASGADYIIQGEGEITLVELLSRINKKLSVSGCNGVIFRQGEKIISNPPRKLIKDLDSLPFPDFSLFDPGKYLAKDTLPALMSRGCIRSCVFCFDVWYYQRKYRVRSPESIVDEIDYLIKNYNMQHIEYSDLLLNGDLRNLEKVCDLLIKKGIKDFSWGGSAAVRKMDKALLAKMYSAGCRSLTFGAESGSQKVLNLMRKGTTVENISQLIRNSAEAGMAVVTNWIIGFPGEERSDILESMRFILKHRKYLYGVGSVCVLAINARTTIYQDAERKGICLSETSGFDWKYVDNDLAERRKRERIFLRFLKEIGLSNKENKDLSDHDYPEQILDKYIDELNSASGERVGLTCFDCAKSGGF